MNSSLVKRSLVIIVGLCLVVLVYFKVSSATSNEDIKTLESLQMYMSGSHIFDADGSLGLEDINDVHYRWRTDGGIKINFGNSVIKLTKKQLEDSYVQELMHEINLDIVDNRLYYEGMEVPY